jgi:glyoxylase-like metal-dependent hydrolase (beta-lactamase superfamily II)
VTALEEIVPGIYGLPIPMAGVPYVNAFIVDGPGGVVIVDTGMPNRAKRVLAALRDIGRGPRDVRLIVLTHHHLDHTGSVNAAASATNAPVSAHPADAAVIMAEAPAPRANRDTAARRILGPLVDRIQPRRIPPLAVRPVVDGDVLGEAGFDMEVVHTPGHTPGHISLLVPSRQALIAGDAAANVFGRLAPPVGLYTEDAESMRRSIERLAGLDFDTACFGHGGALRGHAATRFRTLVDRLAGRV